MKTWKPFNDECPKCGSGAEVYTSAKDEGYAYDGDPAQCTECGHEGSVLIDGDEDDNGDCIATVSWNDYEEE